MTSLEFLNAKKIYLKESHIILDMKEADVKEALEMLATWADVTRTKIAELQEALRNITSLVEMRRYESLLNNELNDIKNIERLIQLIQSD